MPSVVHQWDIQIIDSNSFGNIIIGIDSSREQCSDFDYTSSTEQCFYGYDKFGTIHTNDTQAKCLHGSQMDLIISDANTTIRQGFQTCDIIRIYVNISAKKIIFRNGHAQSALISNINISKSYHLAVSVSGSNKVRLQQYCQKTRVDQWNAFLVAKEKYGVIIDSTEQTNSFKTSQLLCLLREFIGNGYKSCVCLDEYDEKNNNYSIMNIVNKIFKSYHHTQLNKILCKAEILSILLFIRNKGKIKDFHNKEKWNKFIVCLYNAIYKLSKSQSKYYNITNESTKFENNMEFLMVCGYFVPGGGKLYKKIYANVLWIIEMHNDTVASGGYNSALTKQHQLLISGFTRMIHNLLPDIMNCSIYNTISNFYDFIYIKRDFYLNDDMDYDDSLKNIKNITGNHSTAYFNTTIKPHSACIYSWKFKIIRASNVNKIVIGIDSSWKACTNIDYTDTINKELFYAYDSFGIFHTNDSSAKVEEIITTCFSTDQEFYMYLNMRTGILLFRFDNVTIAKISRIDVSKSYHLAISMCGKNDEINIDNYYPQKKKLLKTFVVVKRGFVNEMKEYVNEHSYYFDAIMNLIIEKGFESYVIPNILIENAITKKKKITEIIEDVLNCTQHKEIGSLLNEAEILSILFFCRCRSNDDCCLHGYDFREGHTYCDYLEALCSGVLKLLNLQTTVQTQNSLLALASDKSIFSVNGYFCDNSSCNTNNEGECMVYDISWINQMVCNIPNEPTTYAVHVWEFKIDSIDIFGNIIIGIDSADGKSNDFDYTSNNNTFYGYDRFGKYHTNDSHAKCIDGFIDKQVKVGFQKGDEVRLYVDMSAKIIIFRRGHVQVASISNINISQRYHLAVSVSGESDHVSLKKYYQQADSDTVETLMIVKSVWLYENCLWYYKVKSEITQEFEQSCTNAILQEFSSNGFKWCVCLDEYDEKNGNYSIMSIVERIFECKEHEKRSNILNKAEILSILLCIRSEGKVNDYHDEEKWKYLRLCLYNAIDKLRKKDKDMYNITKDTLSNWNSKTYYATVYGYFVSDPNYELPSRKIVANISWIVSENFTYLTKTQNKPTVCNELSKRYRKIISCYIRGFTDSSQYISEIILSNIYETISRFYDYVYIKRDFYLYGGNVLYNYVTRNAQNLEAGSSTLYYNMSIEPSSSFVHVWIFQILTANTLTIGIDSSGKEHTDIDYSSKKNKSVFYACNCFDMKFYTNDINYDRSKCSVTIDDDLKLPQEVKISVNMSSGILSFEYGNSSIIASGIDAEKRYHLAIALHNKNDEIKFVKYYKTTYKHQLKSLIAVKKRIYNTSYSDNDDVTANVIINEFFDNGLGSFLHVNQPNHYDNTWIMNIVEDKFNCPQNQHFKISLTKSEILCILLFIQSNGQFNENDLRSFTSILYDAIHKLSKIQNNSFNIKKCVSSLIEKKRGSFLRFDGFFAGDNKLHDENEYIYSDVTWLDMNFLNITINPKDSCIHTWQFTITDMNLSGNVTIGISDALNQNIYYSYDCFGKFHVSDKNAKCSDDDPNVDKRFVNKNRKPKKGFEIGDKITLYVDMQSATIFFRKNHIQIASISGINTLKKYHLSVSISNEIDTIHLNKYCKKQKMEEFKSFIIARTRDVDKLIKSTSAYIQAIIAEFINNKCKANLCLDEYDEQNNNYSIMRQVENILKSEQHKQYVSVLNKAEILSILLFICSDSHKIGYYHHLYYWNSHTHWQYFYLCLYNGIYKLSQKQIAKYNINDYNYDSDLKFVKIHGYFDSSEEEQDLKSHIYCDVSWMFNIDVPTLISDYSDISFHDISERYKILISGFMRRVNTSFPNSMSPYIYCMISILFDYVHIEQDFSVYHDGLQYNNITNIIKNTKGTPYTAYFNEPITSNSECVTIYELKIIRYENSKSKLIFGIDSSAKEHITNDFTLSINKHTFYGYDSFGKVYTNDAKAKSISSKNNESIENYFETNQVIQIHLNMKSRMLMIRNGHTEIAKISNIDITKRYYLAVTIYGKNDEIKWLNCSQKTYHPKLKSFIVVKNEFSDIEDPYPIIQNDEDNVNLVINECINNELASYLNVNNKFIMDIVADKFNCQQNQQFNLPLTKAEILSLLLFVTINGQKKLMFNNSIAALIDALNDNTYSKWRYLSLFLSKAVRKLCTNQIPQKHKPQFHVPDLHGVFCAINEYVNFNHDHADEFEAITCDSNDIICDISWMYTQFLNTKIDPKSSVIHLWEFHVERITGSVVIGIHSSTEERSEFYNTSANGLFYGYDLFSNIIHTNDSNAQVDFDENGFKERTKILSLYFDTSSGVLMFRFGHVKIALIKNVDVTNIYNINVIMSAKHDIIYLRNYDKKEQMDEYKHFIIMKRTYKNIDITTKNIIKELIAIGYKSCLCLDQFDEKNDNYSIMTMVGNILASEKYKELNCTLNEAEILCILLLIQNEDKLWIFYIKQFCSCMFSAIGKLSSIQRENYDINIGDFMSNDEMFLTKYGYFSSCREDSARYANEIYYCDVSWIMDLDTKSFIVDFEYSIEKFNNMQSKYKLLIYGFMRRINQLLPGVISPNICYLISILYDYVCLS
eukprot:546360_1